MLLQLSAGLICLLTVVCVGATAATDRAGETYVLVELAPLEKNVVKRQVQYAEPVQAGPQQLQYAQQPGAPQITPEYYAYLQQVQAQQYQGQQPGADLNQLLSARGPQRFQQQIPPRPPQIPEEVRRFQESFNQSPLREQEREDQTNQQLIASGLNPTQVRRERLRQSAQRLAAQQAQENAARQALQAHEQQYQQLYAQQQPQPALVQIPQEIQQGAYSTPAPERVSYSQIAYGSTKLPQQRLEPGKTQLLYARPQAQPTQQLTYRQPQPAPAQPQQQVIYQPQYSYTTLPIGLRAGRPQQPVYQQERPKAGGQLIYSPQAERAQEDSYQPQRPQPPSYRPQRPQPVSYQPQRTQTVLYQPQPTVSYQPQPAVQYAQAEVTQKQTPEQYLIETTRRQPEPQQQVISIPRRPELSLRPETDYQELHAALAARQQQAHIARQQAEAYSSTTPAPRSAIFVTTGRTPSPKAYSIPVEYRNPPQNRPLTESELNALINAGFRVGPEEQEYIEQQYSRGLAKRQNPKPKIGKVPLSEDERKLLAKNGIRNLYRVESAETQDAPVTYVLAVENQKRDTDKSTSS